MIFIFRALRDPRNLLNKKAEEKNRHLHGYVWRISSRERWRELKKVLFFYLGELYNNGSMEVFPSEVLTRCKKMLTLAKCHVWWLCCFDFRHICSVNAIAWTGEYCTLLNDHLPAIVLSLSDNGVIAWNSKLIISMLTTLASSVVNLVLLCSYTDLYI